MTAPKRSITVTQQFAGDQSTPARGDQPAVTVYRYIVKSAKNLTYPTVHQTLTRDEVDGLINGGVEVTIL